MLHPINNNFRLFLVRKKRCGECRFFVENFGRKTDRSDCKADFLSLAGLSRDNW